MFDLELIDLVIESRFEPLMMKIVCFCFFSLTGLLFD